ncbi:CvpA family protein [Bradyrhizobium sp. ISRA443]|uniref:CvpA family protein n=1 Tax=unclassified Bradyrhizobium TaxID=2631580 RepID=UPI00247A58D9|nr:MULTISPECIES: CvpA family protein [unclassified Bradyrhizobium]WGR95171.1 CvpA family protein [Bradyrhizobium sp. ISRA435]WGS00093.1 CvpA family protein [Bradyrhizobium sp. ISRA436]WGS06982.1 CvpA family protein [Bradyrhizobium sp. ISRA437]WGS13864.1 CvpA family protein [Bradyrhizobium sp. ISRA443]
MNSFDAVVALGLLFAIVTGFSTGLLRSAITILAYLVAMPIAVAVLSIVGPGIANLPASPFPPNGVLLFALFLVTGVVLGKLARTMLDDAVGSEIGIADRLGGALLGAVRAGLVVTTLVLVFDQLVPLAKQPQFLNGSRLRPLFSAAGQTGFRSLPPEITMTIERLRRERRT